jgi:hypothetical protein
MNTSGKQRLRRVTNTPALQNRRRVLQQAVELLSEAAIHEKLVQTYARNTPAVKLRANAFYFGKPDAPPRAIIYGRRLYIHAPGAKLPPDAIEVPEEFRKERHLGSLHAFIPLTCDKDLTVLRKIIRSVAGSVRRS